jgi:hypothetical protein
LAEFAKREMAYETRGPDFGVSFVTLDAGVTEDAQRQNQDHINIWLRRLVNMVSIYLFVHLNILSRLALSSSRNRVWRNRRLCFDDGKVEVCYCVRNFERESVRTRREEGSCSD